MTSHFLEFIHEPRATLSRFAKYTEIPMHTIDNWRALRRLPPEWCQYAVVFLYDAWYKEEISSGGFL